MAPDDNAVSFLSIHLILRPVLPILRFLVSSRKTTLVQTGILVPQCFKAQLLLRWRWAWVSFSFGTVETVFRLASRRMFLICWEVLFNSFSCSTNLAPVVAHLVGLFLIFRTVNHLTRWETFREVLFWVKAILLNYVVNTSFLILKEHLQYDAWNLYFFSLDKIFLNSVWNLNHF